MTLSEMITVLKAAEEEKQIQYRTRSNKGPWLDFCLNPICGDAYNFQACDYRVKPEPREWWIANQCVLVAYTKDEAAKFSAIHVREVLP